MSRLSVGRINNLRDVQAAIEAITTFINTLGRFDSASLESTVSDLQADLASLQTQLSSLSTQEASDVTAENAQNAQITSMQATITSLQATVAGLGGGGGGGPTTIADGADVAEGATTDAATTGDTAGTVSAKLRGLTKILGDIWDSVNHRIKVDGSGVTQPVSIAATVAVNTGLAQPLTDTQLRASAVPMSAAALPLPSGAATAAAQTTGNASLSSIDTKTPALASGRVPVDGSGVTQPVSGTVGVNNFPATQPVSGTVNAKLDDGAGTAVTVGQKTMTASLPIVVASDQSSIPTSAGNVQATYHALYRLAARPYALSFATTANTRKQFATIHHPATSTKTVRIRRVLVAVESTSVAGIFMFDLVRINTAPVTGNPAITPPLALASDPAVDSVCLALPTTAATEIGSPISTLEFNLGITGAASTVNPPVPLTWYELYSEDEQNPVGEERPLTIRPGVLEGFAVTLDPNAAATLKGYVKIVFTEV